MKITDIIKDLVHLVGNTAGIIMIAIGGTMIISATLKLYVFDLNYSRFNSPEAYCQHILDDRSISAKPVTEVEEEKLESGEDKQKQACCFHDRCCTCLDKSFHVNFHNFKY